MYSICMCLKGATQRFTSSFPNRNFHILSNGLHAVSNINSHTHTETHPPHPEHPTPAPFFSLQTVWQNCRGCYGDGILSLVNDCAAMVGGHSVTSALIWGDMDNILTVPYQTHKYIPEPPLIQNLTSKLVYFL